MTANLHKLLTRLQRATDHDQRAISNATKDGKHPVKRALQDEEIDDILAAIRSGNEDLMDAAVTRVYMHVVIQAHTVMQQYIDDPVKDGIVPNMDDMLAETYKVVKAMLPSYDGSGPVYNVMQRGLLPAYAALAGITADDILMITDMIDAPYMMLMDGPEGGQKPPLNDNETWAIYLAAKSGDADLRAKATMICWYHAHTTIKKEAYKHVKKEYGPGIEDYLSEAKKVIYENIPEYDGKHQPSTWIVKQIMDAFGQLERQTSYGVSLTKHGYLMQQAVKRAIAALADHCKTYNPTASEVYSWLQLNGNSMSISADTVANIMAMDLAVVSIDADDSAMQISDKSTRDPYMATVAEESVQQLHQRIYRCSGRTQHILQWLMREWFPVHREEPTPAELARCYVAPGGGATLRPEEAAKLLRSAKREFSSGYSGLVSEGYTTFNTKDLTKGWDYDTEVDDLKRAMEDGLAFDDDDSDD